jgi:hypothetical protein
LVDFRVCFFALCLSASIFFCLSLFKSRCAWSTALFFVAFALAYITHSQMSAKCEQRKEHKQQTIKYKTQQQHQKHKQQ